MADCISWFICLSRKSIRSSLVNVFFCLIILHISKHDNYLQKGLKVIKVHERFIISLLVINILKSYDGCHGIDFEFSLMKLRDHGSCSDSKKVSSCVVRGKIRTLFIEIKCISERIQEDLRNLSSNYSQG